MNNIERNGFDFVLDTMINRCRSLDETLGKYSEQDKKILYKIIVEQKEELKKNHKNLSNDCYNDLMDAYKWIELLLCNHVI